MTADQPTTDMFKCISCRIPEPIYDEFRGLLGILEKNNNYFVANAITEYIRIIKTGDMPKSPSKGLLKDRFAYTLEQPESGDE